MATVNVAEGKARFSELIARAEAGEEMIVARRGKPVVKLVRIDSPKKPFDVETIRRHLESMPMHEDSRDFMRKFRDDARY